MINVKVYGNLKEKIEKIQKCKKDYIKNQFKNIITFLIEFVIETLAVYGIVHLLGLFTSNFTISLSTILATSFGAMVPQTVRNFMKESKHYKELKNENYNELRTICNYINLQLVKMVDQNVYSNYSVQSHYELGNALITNHAYKLNTNYRNYQLDEDLSACYIIYKDLLDKEQIIRQENSQDVVINYGILDATEVECLLKHKHSLVKKRH